MLSEEEKKAIEYLKQNDIVEIQYDNYGLESIHRVGIDEKQTILNLIEKQSKEIEELKEIYQTGYVNGCVTKVYEINKKWKDKIKAKIEEYEKALNILLQKNEWIEPSDTIKRNKFLYYIEFGQSLLEKE